MYVNKSTKGKMTLSAQGRPKGVLRTTIIRLRITVIFYRLSLNTILPNKKTRYQICIEVWDVLSEIETQNLFKNISRITHGELGRALSCPTYLTLPIIII